VITFNIPSTFNIPFNIPQSGVELILKTYCTVQIIDWIMTWTLSINLVENEIRWTPVFVKFNRLNLAMCEGHCYRYRSLVRIERDGVAWEAAVVITLHLVLLYEALPEAPVKYICGGGGGGSYGEVVVAYVNTVFLRTEVRTETKMSSSVLRFFWKGRLASQMELIVIWWWWWFRWRRQW